MKYESLILTIILLALAIWLGSELKSYLPELLEPVRPKYEVVTLDALRIESGLDPMRHLGGLDMTNKAD